MTEEVEQQFLSLKEATTIFMEGKITRNQARALAGLEPVKLGTQKYRPAELAQHNAARSRLRQTKDGGTYIVPNRQDRRHPRVRTFNFGGPKVRKNVFTPLPVDVEEELPAL